MMTPLGNGSIGGVLLGPLNEKDLKYIFFMVVVVWFSFNKNVDQLMDLLVGVEAWSLLAYGIFGFGQGMTPGVVKVHHMVYSEIRGKQTCTLEVVHQAPVGQRKLYSIYW